MPYFFYNFFCNFLHLATQTTEQEQEEGLAVLFKIGYYFVVPATNAAEWLGVHTFIPDVFWIVFIIWTQIAIIIYIPYNLVAWTFGNKEPMSIAEAYVLALTMMLIIGFLNRDTDD